MDKVQEIINEMKAKYEIKDLNLNASLTDLQIDSLDVVEFLLSLEDKYNITFEAEEMQDLKTASDLIELIKKKVN